MYSYKLPLVLYQPNKIPSEILFIFLVSQIMFNYIYFFLLQHLYASETWTLKIPYAFKMWTHIRMMRISYTEHRTNESIIQNLKM